MSDDLAAYEPLAEEDYLPVARRILAETDPHLPPLDERIATLLFQSAQTKYSNQYNYRARVAAEQERESLRERIETQRRALEATQQRAEVAEAEVVALREALEQAMPLLPGGTPTDLDPATYQIVAACDAALEGDAGQALLAELVAAREMRQAVMSGDPERALAAIAAYDEVVKAS